ncbi:MAG: hypothetical protein COB08_011055 [Rhodobacteraceae bacterium]|nr:hypothetical protein [Paracoccaceae bacterium]
MTVSNRGSFLNSLSTKGETRPPRVKQSIFYLSGEPSVGMEVRALYDTRLRELQNFFDLHVRDRMLAGIGEAHGNSGNPIQIAPRLFEIQMTSPNRFVYQGFAGLFEMMLCASKIDKSILENKFPKTDEQFEDGYIYPFGLLFSLSLLLAEECLMQQRIIAVKESDSLISIVPPHLLKSLAKPRQSFLQCSSDYKDVRFIAVKNLLSDNDLLADPVFMKEFEKFGAGEAEMLNPPDEKKKGGPYLDGSEAARGKKIGKLLSEWEYETEGDPLLKLRKGDFIAVIENSYGFTQTMAANIWGDRPTKGRWSNRGSPKIGSAFISKAEIENRFNSFKTTR